MSELLLGLLGFVSSGVGVWLAARQSSAAPSWMVVGAGFAFAVALRMPSTLGPLSVFLAIVASAASVGLLSMAWGLKRERVALLDAADDLDVMRVMREARTHRLSLRMRSRPRPPFMWPGELS